MYNVELHFAEIFFGAVGKRIFNVTAEGIPVVGNLDIYQQVGDNAPHIEIVNREVTDGFLTIDFTPVIENPKISAIAVFGLPDTRGYTVTPSAVPTPLASESPSALPSLQPSQSPSVSIAPTGSSAPTLTLLRKYINAGDSESYVDGYGNVWGPDDHFTSGDTKSLFRREIRQTDGTCVQGYCR